MADSMYTCMLDQPFPSDGQLGLKVRLTELPMNLVAMIVSYIDDLPTLLHLAGTCRLIHWLSLPRLYRRVNLRVRRPSRRGRVSPYTQALNALVTRNVGSLVREFRIYEDGESYGQASGDQGEESSARAEKMRFPGDAEVLLAISLRAAIDKMVNLESFTWDVNSRMLPTLYSGLSVLPNLQSLSIRFPNNRHPHTMLAIPGFPVLRCLKITHLDPLCYPDDISSCLLESKNLESLQIHWSPRMRNEREVSVHLMAYFGRCLAAGYKPSLRKIGMQNLFAVMSGALDITFPDKVEEVTLLDVFEDNPDLEFMTEGWSLRQLEYHSKMKMLRTDNLTMCMLPGLERIGPLDRLYVIGSQSEVQLPFVALSSSPSPVNGTQSFGASPQSGDASPSDSSTPNTSVSASFKSATSPLAPSQRQEPRELRESNIKLLYVNVISELHGPFLKHLFLPASAVLTRKQTVQIVKACPNLTQLAFALESDERNLFVPLQHLWVLRILHCLTMSSDGFCSIYEFSMENVYESPESFCGTKKSTRIISCPNKALQYLGLGRGDCEKIFELTPSTEADKSKSAESCPDNAIMRVLRPVTHGEVEDIEIWKMDCHELL